MITNARSASSLLDQATRVATTARQEVRHGRLQRTLAVMTAFAAIVSGFEAWVQHVRGDFNHWLMWTPVALTPPTVAAAGAAVASPRAARRLLPWISVIMLADGIVGFIFHVRGVKRLPGGFKLGTYNVVMGPPMFAPLLITSVGVLGILASLLRRERLQR